MAEVYRAVSHGPGGFQRQFVIKRIRQEKAASKEFVEMFINEARISALLEHPNIVQVYDFGQVDGDYFLAMEYLRGRNLLAVGRRLRSNGSDMPPDLAAYVAREVARGLYHAHTLTNQGKPLGIVHRDVSPSNIMLLRTGGVKLLDFGIARATMKLRTITPIGGLVKGKLSYLSPEQVRGQGVDGRSDVFSLGVVLWECLTGLRLFYDPNDLETMRNVLHRPIPKPSEVRTGVPAALDAITLRALQRDLDLRYPDAAALASALEEHLRECRFSPESVVRLLEELFAAEDSARELPLPGESSVFASKPATATTVGSAASESVPPPAAPSLGEEHDTQNDYATVSSVHRLAEIATRHRRRRLYQVGAGGLVVTGAMSLAALLLPVRPMNVPWGPVAVRPLQVVAAAATPPEPAAVAPALAALMVDPPPSQAGIQIEPAQGTDAVVLPDPEPQPAPRRPATRPGRSRRDEPGTRPPAADDRKERASSTVDPGRARRALSRGVEALRSGEYILAVQELEIALLATPSSHEAVKALAEAEFELARYGRALAHARKAVALAPKDAPSRALLGDAYFKLRRYKDAGDAYAAAGALAPGDASIRARQKRAREKIGGADKGAAPEKAPAADDAAPPSTTP
jgi:serine/threonine protein kinase